MSDLNIISQNVNGLNNCIKRNKILQQLKKEKGDILLLQETHLTQEEHRKLGRISNAQVFSSSYSSSRRGVATIIKNHIPFQKIRSIVDKEGRFVLVMGRIENNEITLINIYYPPVERNYRSNSNSRKRNNYNWRRFESGLKSQLRLNSRT